MKSTAVIAVLFAVLALVAWKKRPKEGDEEKPSILDRLDGLSVWGALAMGFAQGVIVIKNIPLAAAAGARLGEADLDTAALIVGLVVFALVAASGVVSECMSPCSPPLRDRTISTCLSNTLATLRQRQHGRCLPTTSVRANGPACICTHGATDSSATRRRSYGFLDDLADS